MLYAQFAIVSDKEGFVYVRSSASIGKNIVDTLKNQHLIFIIETENNWINIDYKGRKGDEKNGYLYKDRFSLISALPSVPQKRQTKDSIIFAGKNIELILTQESFIKDKHNITYSNIEKTHITLIDKQEYFGTDGGLPQMKYASILLRIDNQEIKLPRAALQNLYEPNLSNTTINFDKRTNTFFITSLNSEGAGAYYVIWKIVNGVYVERLVLHGA